MLSRTKLVFAAAILFISGSIAAAQEAPTRSIVRLSYIPGNFALPVFVGIEHGLFAREGLSVSAIPVTDEAALMRSLGQGGTDFAIGSQSLLLSIAENKLDVRVVAIASRGREVELVVPAWDTTTKTLADVKGKTLLLLNGVHNFDAVPELYRGLALSKMRLSDVRIQFVDLANIQLVMDPRFRQAYAQRKVGGIFMFSEFGSNYVEEKKARVVLDSEGLTKLIGRIGAQPVFASKAAIDKEPKTVERFVRAWARTQQHISDPAYKDAVVRVLQIYYLRQYGFLLKKELAERYLAAAKYDRLVWTDEEINEVTINAKALSAARNLLFASIKDADKRPFKTVPPVAEFVDMSFAKKALVDLAEETKKAAEKPDPKEAPKNQPPASAEKPPEKPPAEAEKPKATPSEPPKQ